MTIFSFLLREMVVLFGISGSHRTTDFRLATTWTLSSVGKPRTYRSGKSLLCTFGLPHWTQWQLLEVTYRSKLPKHLRLVTQSRVARTALVCPSRSFTVDPLSIKTRTGAPRTKQPTSQGPRRNIPSSASPEGEAAWGETQTKGRKAASLSLFLRQRLTLLKLRELGQL